MSTPPEHLIDARGHQCPYPVLQLAAWAKHAAPEATVTLLSDDTASRTDVPAWARMTGHTILTVTEHPTHVEFVVQHTAPQPQGTT